MRTSSSLTCLPVAGRRVQTAVAVGLLLWAIPGAAATLEVLAGVGEPGGLVPIGVRLDTNGASIGSLAHDLTFDPTVLTLNFRGDTPDCALVQPAGRFLDIRLFDGGARLRATVTPLSPSGPFMDGPLYYCGFNVSPRASLGEYAVILRDSQVVAPDGSPITDVSELSDLFEVVGSAPVSIRAADVTARAGDVVRVPVLLAAAGRVVAETANDIELDPRRLGFRFRSGHPDCEVNPLLGKLLSVAAFDPERISVAVVPRFGRAAIPDGEIYACFFDVLARAPAGRAELRVQNGRAFDQEGREILSVLTGDGSVVVSGRVCPGDCNDDGRVTVGELILAVSIGLGQTPAAECPRVDGNRDGRVTVTELLQAVNRALSGCG